MKGKMVKRLLAALMVTVIGVGSLAGCGGSKESGSEAAAEESSAAAEESTDAEESAEPEESTEAAGDYVYRVGFVNIDDADNCCYPATQKFKEYVESDEFAAAVGADKVEALCADSAGDIEKQTTNVETLISKGVDIMFIIGVDTAGNTTAVEACNAEGIPVFMVGTEATGGDWKFVGFDETELGKYQGEWCVENLPENAKICYLEGTPGREASELRKKGFEDAVAAREDLEIISSQTGDFDTANAMQVTEDWIQTYGDEIGCVVAADGKMIVGACEALKGANMIDAVTTCGVVSVEDDAYLLEEGTEDYAVFVYWPSIGTLCGEIAERVYNGEEIDERTNIELHHMTSDNYEELLAEYK